MIALVMLTSMLLAELGPRGCDGAAIGSVVEIKLVDNEPVQIRRVGQASWVQAEKGMELCVGDQVRSRYRSRARVRVESAEIGRHIDVVVGVNTRILMMGAWNGVTSAPGDRAILDVVHGVVRLKTPDRENGSSYYVRTGSSVCSVWGDRVYSNWDPFKREANHLAERGRVSCTFQDSTQVVDAGNSLEIISGMPQAIKTIVPLILDAFSNATDF